MKGKASLLITLIIAAIGVKVLTMLANNYVASIDPSNSFSGMINGFLGLSDIIFYGLVALIVVTIPYYLSRRSKKKEQPAPARVYSSTRE